MTDAERAVTDAARALEKSGGIPAFDALIAAVRALPRPLSEQLAELRAGDVVTSGHSETPRLVVANDVEAQKLWLRDAHRADQQPEPRMYRDIRRIISNPEASNG